MRSVYEGFANFRQECAAQADRAVLWAVVAFAAGIALFFTWPFDPPVWAGPVAALVGLACLRLPRARIVAIAIIAAAAGHSAAHFRTTAVATPLLERELRFVSLTGLVTETERRPGTNRIVIAPDAVPGLAARDTPRHLRINIPRGHGLPRAGERIRVRATVGPAMRPAVPDGFQFQRFLYFQQIGGTGYAVGRWETVAAPPDLTWREAFVATTESWRRAIAARVGDVLTGDTGSVATALINGEQSVIPEDLQEAYRIAGLAHLLSISGFHMTLLAGAVFFLTRRALALFPAVALRTDTKKIAAWSALGLTFGYLLISGMDIPTVRAFMMIAVVLVAVLLDRTALSLRTIAVAALVLMAVYPDAVFGASFQMSFAAVLALIALYENTWLRIPWRTPSGELNLFRAIGVYIAALVMTDLVAGGATNLFALYHFNRVPTYSLLANLIAGPLTGFWIMPAALFGVVLMPVGLETYPLQVMGAGVSALNGIARTIAAWPAAQFHVPPMSTFVLTAAAGGLVFICIWKGRFRWLGVVPVVVALVQPWMAATPDILVDESARVVAVSDDEGRLMFSPGRTGRFVRSVWAERYGASKATWPGPDMACDANGCILTRADKRVLIAFGATAVAEDCGAVDAIISAIPAYDFCRDGVIVDRFHLLRDGSHALYVTNAGMDIRAAGEVVGNRVWTRGVPNVENEIEE